MKYKEFNDSLFNMELLFITDCDPDKREEYLSKKFKGLKKDESGQFQCLTSTITIKRTNGVVQTKYLLWIAEKGDFYGLLHEIVHLCKRVFTDRGIPFNETNDEVMAYWIEDWFKRLWRFMNKNE